MTEKRTQTFAKAIREALQEEMKRDINVILMGQDIRKSVWGVTGGLHEEFSPERVLPLPIAENGFTSAAVGAAMTGMRPVVEFMFGDFLLLAMDAICNQAAKYRYMCGGGEFKIPLVLRAAGCGLGSGTGLHHSQFPESWLIPFPGLKIVAPATPNDAKGLMISAIRDENPVVFIEHKMLYAKSGPMDDLGPIDIGKARVAKEGRDITLVTYSSAYYKSIAVADKMAQEGISVEVIDLRTIKPLDKETIIDSVKKTNRLIIVEDACKTGGVGAHIAAMIAEEAIEYLDGSIVRVSGFDTSIPAGKKPEQVVVPTEDKIYSAIKTSLRG